MCIEIESIVVWYLYDISTYRLYNNINILVTINKLLFFEFSYCIDSLLTIIFVDYVFYIIIYSYYCICSILKKENKYYYDY